MQCTEKSAVCCVLDQCSGSDRGISSISTTYLPFCLWCSQWSGALLTCSLRVLLSSATEQCSGAPSLCAGDI